MKVLKKLIVIILIIMLINIWPIVQNISEVQAANAVQLSLVPQPYIDVVLAKAGNATNLTNFKTDLLSALSRKGVDTTKVNVTSIESQSLDIQSAFTWNQDLDNRIGSISIVNSGQNVTMRGNERNAGKNAIWIMPNKNVEQTFTFGYNIDFGDSFNAAGMLLRVEQKGNTLNGYMLSFNNYNWVSQAGGANGAIWEFSYDIGNNDKNITKTLKKALDIQKSGTLTVKVSSSEIEISGGGLPRTETYVLEKTMGTGFGFFSDHYNHNCSSIGSFTLTDISLTTENVKKMEEILREPEWRENSIKVMTNVVDNINKQLDEPTSLGELLTRMINDNIHYVAWGQNINKQQNDNLIAANNGNGLFISNTNYSNSIEKTAEYIKSLIDAKKPSNYVLLNENMVLTSDDPSIMKNTANAQYPYGKWKIIHDCEYYENDIGQFAQSDKYISDMITSFNKTGKYEIFYEDRNVNPTYIYVHRKPVAEIEVQRNGNNVNLISLGYDLDNYSNNRGIAEEEWKYRKVGETTWKDGKLTNISDGTDYLVQLRVKDFQNTWSDPETKYITKRQTQPIASFKIKNQNTSIYEKVEVVDGSYDPSGGTIISRKWTVYKGDNKIYEGSNPLGNYKSYGIGDYKMSLVVTNNRNVISEAFTRSFKIIPDDEAPEFTASPTSSEWGGAVTVNLKFKDRLGSGFKNYQYAITQSQGTPSSWSSPIRKMIDNITINQDGIQYLHIKATDNAGNVSEDRVLGPYKVDGTPPIAVVSHTPTQWVIDNVTINWSFVDSESGLDYVELPDGTTTTNGNGKYVVTRNGKYTFKAYDKIGNEKVHVENITNIDRTSPEGVLSLSSTQLTDQGIQILWNAIDGQSGFEKIILPDATSSKNATGSYNITQMGTYTFIIYDKVGNDKQISIEVNNVDMNKPELWVTQEITRWTNEDITLHWKAIDNQSGLKEIVLPNSEKAKGNEGDYVAVENGIYTFLAYDKIGNGTLVTHEVKNIDKKGPFLKLKSETLEDSEEIKIIWEMEDNQSGLRNIVLPNGKTSIQAKGEFIAKENGIYSFVAYDNVGNYTVMELEIDEFGKEEIVFNLWKRPVGENQYKIGWEITKGTEYFKHILLPDNTYSEELSGEFDANEQGTYTFLAYNKAGRETKCTITIE